MKRILALTVALAFGGTGLSAATLINGSFETPVTNVGAFVNLPGGSTAIEGWTVGGNSIDWIGSYWQHADGMRSIDLSGGSAGRISQDITGLVIGTRYDLSFALAGNPVGLPVVKTVNVAVGDENADFTFDTAGKTVTDMGWVMETFRFTAGATTERLTFTSLNGTAFGPALDNVSISAAVPLPGAMWLLGGAFAGLGMVRRKR